MDRLTPDRRRWNMSRIRGQNTAPERRVRSLLHHRGFRFSLRRKELPGKPDIVLPRFHTVVFVHVASGTVMLDAETPWCLKLALNSGPGSFRET